MAKLNKYKPYESYTDTSAVWYKQKPAHWECERFKYHFIEKKKKNSTCLPAGAISFGEVIFKNEDNLSQDTKSSYQEVCAGEFLINPLNLNFDLKSLRTALSTIDVVVSTGYIVLQDCGFLHPRFARWLLQQFDVSHMKTLGAGVRQTINYADIGNSLFCRPTFEEQKIIAAFLDYETQKIDKLIERQQQLIELLKEKRQAVISHAVTKGLNPDVPMKDSGVEWLGEVPEHWSIKRLKHISPKVGVGLVINPSSYTRDEGVYFIFGGDVKEYGFDLGKTRKISPKDSNNLLSSRLNNQDLVSVRVGYPGITAVVTKDLEGSNCASVIIIRNGEFNSGWLCAAMNSWVGRQQVELVSYGAAQKQFNVADAVEFIFPVPPYDEQVIISNFVKNSLDKFDTVSLQAQVQIGLLQERRTALISAAVTGKIDVRDWVAPDMQDAEEPQETTV
ncbi:hypothetical protein ACTVPT_25035 [Serratia bockelmannii]|uniref:hypothetical protein n=1 Tax=Serratia TaxID=613 RepID=UPI001BB0A20A|nr:hypothetical protein [Serratia marcescens]